MTVNTVVNAKIAKTLILAKYFLPPANMSSPMLKVTDIGAVR